MEVKIVNEKGYFVVIGTGRILSIPFTDKVSAENYATLVKNQDSNKKNKVEVMSYIKHFERFGNGGRKKGL